MLYALIAIALALITIAMFAPRQIIGWILIGVFGLNLIYSLFFTMGESFTSHIPAIILSVVMLYVGYKLVRKKKGKAINKEEPIL